MKNIYQIKDIFQKIKLLAFIKYLLILSEFSFL